MHARTKILAATVVGALLAFAPRTTAAAEVVETLEGPVAIASLAKLEHPWGMAFLPDGRLLITEKPGRLRVYADGKLSEPVAGVPKVDFLEQGGLLDVEIDPDFARNGLVYLAYSEAAEQQPPDAKLVADPRLGPFVNEDDTTLKGSAVARGKLVGNALEGVKVIWRQAPKTIGMGHFGGRLVFGRDGQLFITSGDRQRFEPAQDMAASVGKILRIKPDGSIPKDNPFAGRKGQDGAIWTVGHRNPLGAALHPRTGALWQVEMGPKGGDEFNRIERGRNYGWPVVSNGDNYDDSPIPDHRTQPKFAAPVRWWNPSISPSGLLFYTGAMFPGWRDSVLMGGLSSQALIRLRLRDDTVAGEERIDLHRRIRDVIQAPDGAVLLLVDGEKGELLRLTPASAGATAQR